MVRARRAAVVTAMLAVVVGVLPASAQEVPAIPSTDLLPPVAPDEPAPDATPVCGDDGLRCVRYVERELARWEDHFGCDHRAVFPTVYRMLTREIRLVLEDDPAFFDDPAGIGLEALAFYELFEQMITDHLAGRPIPDAWQVAMDAARQGDWTGGHDMLLAINAHVQRDMPHALARIGLVLPDGRSRKPDHDRGNRILNRAYGPIVREVGRRYDPLMSDVERLPVLDDVAANQLVAGWREGVWRNAESLVTTRGSDLAPVSEAAIERNAATWAQAIRTGEVPGRRELRDAHCAAALAAEEQDTEAPSPPSPPAPGGEAPAAAPDHGVDPGAVDGAAAPLPTTGGGGGLLGLVLLTGWWRSRPRPTAVRA
jgi:hypothetical protein